ncbi:MAG TPA: hypothetical protein VGQ57_17950 [Polyangiaceae bacterium]|nr:hypothetical protein [Polyangiaceae bacterium]
MPFRLQTDAVRARGRKSLNKGKSRVRRRKGKAGESRAARRARNRAAFRATQKRSRKTARKSISGKKARRYSRKEYVARRAQTSRDYVALKKYRAAHYGPIPFELQPSWLRASKGKKYRQKRARWAKARSGR